MNDFLLLNIFILLFFIFTILEDYYKPKLSRVEKVGRRISPFLLIMVIILGTSLIMYFLIFGTKQFVSLYLKFLLSTLVIAHALWISLKKNLTTKILLIIAALIIIVARFTYPSTFNHNLLIFLAIFWLGPFFVKVGIMTKKRFIIISILWFLYDIVFVWLTPLSNKVIATTNAIQFPLALVSGKSSIGLADLFWAGFLLCIIKKNKIKLLAITLLIGSNFLLEFYSTNIVRISIFPLLVLWIPLGFYILFYEK